jgi:Na+/phosphate symporter
VIAICADNMNYILSNLHDVLEEALDGLQHENLKKLSKAFKKFGEIEKKAHKLKDAARKALEQINDDDMESAHMFILVVDYLTEMTGHVEGIIEPCLNHVDNNHKPLMKEQIEELKKINEALKYILQGTIKVFNTLDAGDAESEMAKSDPFVKLVRGIRKNQLKRVKNGEVGTKNSILYLHLLGEFRNLGLFSNRLVQVCHDLIINPEVDSEKEK